MKLFGSTGCPVRRELFDIEQRQCDGCELNIQIVTMPLQQPLKIIQTYNTHDVV